MAVTAYVGLGSNLDDPRDQVERALVELDGLPGTRCVAKSRLYRSAPMGPAGQPDYINAVAKLETELAPEALLLALQGIEKAHGRTRNGERWGPRTLDLDILLYADHCVDRPELQIPHSGIAERPFVLYPLHEIAGDMEIPGHGPLSELLKNCSPEGLEPLNDV